MFKKAKITFKRVLPPSRANENDLVIYIGEKMFLTKDRSYTYSANIAVGFKTLKELQRFVARHREQVAYWFRQIEMNPKTEKFEEVSCEVVYGQRKDFYK